MAGRGGRQAAKNLCALARDLKDDYRRTRSKTARDWPHKKKDKPPGPPRIRTANLHEQQAAQGFREKQNAA
jgi:hypothetical protein